MRFSSSALGERAPEPWPKKAVRSKTSRVTPVSTSPQFSAVRPSTGSLVAVQVAEKAPQAVEPLGPR